MKMYLAFVSLIAACGVCLATIIPIPGEVAVQPVFDKADLVCKCTVSSVSVSDGPFLDATGRTVLDAAGRPETGERIKANLIINDAYKLNGQNGQTIVLDYSRERFMGVAFRNGLTLLLFLTRGNGGTYTPADPFIGITSFSSLPQQTGQTGLAKLQAALGAASQQQDRHDSIHALQLLQGFDQLSPESLATVSTLITSTDPEIAATALAVLVKTKTPESVAALRTFVDKYPGDVQLGAFISLGAELGEVSDNRARVDIEALSASRFLSIRLGAMDALRKMRNRESAPVLIQRLDDSNPTIRYSAVITLAEILNKFDAGYAPSKALFDQNRDFYINNWKAWWSQQNH